MNAGPIWSRDWRAQGAATDPQELEAGANVGEGCAAARRFFGKAPAPHLLKLRYSRPVTVDAVRINTALRKVAALVLSSRVHRITTSARVSQSGNSSRL